MRDMDMGKRERVSPSLSLSLSLSLFTHTHTHTHSILDVKRESCVPLEVLLDVVQVLPQENNE